MVKSLYPNTIYNHIKSTNNIDSMGDSPHTKINYLNYYIYISSKEIIWNKLYTYQSVLASSITRRVKHLSLLIPGTRIFLAADFVCSTFCETTAEKLDA